MIARRHLSSLLAVASEALRRQKREMEKSEKKQMSAWSKKEWATLSEEQQVVSEQLTQKHKKVYKDLSYAEQGVLWKLQMDSVSPFLLMLGRQVLLLPGFQFVSL